MLDIAPQNHGHYYGVGPFMIIASSTLLGRLSTRVCFVGFCTHSARRTNGGWSAQRHRLLLLHECEQASERWLQLLLYNVETSSECVSPFSGLNLRGLYD